MLTAARARFLTRTIGISQRYVNFTVDAYDLSRASIVNDSELHILWKKYFLKTGFEKNVDEFYEISAEILLSRSVDSFQLYLADIIGWALWRQPIEGLMQEANRWAAEYSIDLDEAVKDIAWIYSEKISYGGFSRMVKFIENTFTIELLIDVKTKDSLRKAIFIRNMIAHNDSCKNSRYCKEFNEPLTNIGQRVRASLPEAKNYIKLLEEFVELVDITLVNKINDFSKMK